MILKTELSPAEVDGLRKVTRHAPAKSAISKKVRDRLITFGYIEQSVGRLLPTAKGILYFANVVIVIQTTVALLLLLTGTLK
jgi:hypothetical protein